MGDPTKDGGSTATLQLSNNVLYNWGYNTCYGGGYAYTNFINNFLNRDRERENRFGIRSLIWVKPQNRADFM